MEGINNESVEILMNNTSKDKIKDLKNSIDEGKFEKNSSNGSVSNFKHLISRTLIWFIIFFIIYYLLFIKSAVKNKINVFKAAIKKFLKLVFYVLVGFTSVAISSKVIIGEIILNPILIFIVVIFICEGITLLIIRKDKLKVKDSLISTLMMMAIIIYSQY